MEQLIGWRKLGAWFLIFALCAVSTLRLVWSGAVTDIPSGIANLLIWVTTAFFAANVFGEHSTITGSSPAFDLKKSKKTETGGGGGADEARP